jgi:hypothetical protein
MELDIAGLFGRGAHVCECLQNAALLIGRQSGQDRLHCVAANLVDLLDGFAAGVRGVNRHYPTVCEVAATLNETALLHAIDDARNVGERHVEQLGDPAHGHGPFALQEVQNVKVSRADRAQTAVPGNGASLPRDHRLELLEDLLDQVRTRCPGRRGSFVRNK